MIIFCNNLIVGLNMTSKDKIIAIDVNNSDDNILDKMGSMTYFFPP
jgi:hypothetical protein